MRLKIIVLFCFLIIFASHAHAFSFAVFGDNHGSGETFEKLIDKINQDKEIIFAINVGDAVLRGTEKEFKAYLKTVFKLNVPVYNVPGNHDTAHGGWKVFKRIFGYLYRSFDYRDCHFVILDNSFGESFNKRQFEWFKNDLSQSRARHKFVFLHRPIFDPSEIFDNYVMSGRQVTEEMMRLFEKYKVEYVFAGHIHGYASADRGGVRYIITGGAGAPLRLPPEFGGFYNYVKVTVGNGKATDKVQRVYE